MRRRLAIGDIHGGFKAMRQVLDKAKFKKDKDILIVIGDVVDGWPDSYECIEYLRKVKHLVLIMGNHDVWFIDWLKTGVTPQIWTKQGGKATMHSYQFREAEDITNAIKFFEQALPYWLSPDNKLFVHGGLQVNLPLSEQDRTEMMWDRSLLEYAKQCHYTKGCNVPKKLGVYDEIYIGHSTTTNFSDIPIKLCNVWCIDQGGGYEGKLSVIDVDTNEFWQSDNLKTFYPTHNGRIWRT